MLGIATFTTNKSKIVTNPASSSTDSPSLGGLSAALIDAVGRYAFAFILLIQSNNASIVGLLLNNYNLTVYAITLSNEITDANNETHAQRSGRFPANTTRTPVTCRCGAAQRGAAPYTGATARGSSRAGRCWSDLVHLAGTGTRYWRICRLSGQSCARAETGCL